MSQIAQFEDCVLNIGIYNIISIIYKLIDKFLFHQTNRIDDAIFVWKFVIRSRRLTRLSMLTFDPIRINAGTYFLKSKLY